MTVANTTVFNTDDVMHYVEPFFSADSYKIKIRYMNQPKKSSWKDEVGRWALVKSDYGKLEIGLLRPAKMMAQSPLVALARAANADDNAPDQLILDLLHVLGRSRCSRKHRELSDSFSTDRKIRIRTKADKATCDAEAVKNLRAKIKTRQNVLETERIALAEMKLELRNLQIRIPKWETEVIPGEEAELVKLKARLAKKELALKKNHPEKVSAIS